MSSQHIRVAQSLYDSLGRMDFDGMSSCLVEDVEAWFPFRPSMEPPQAILGRTAVIDRLRESVPRLADRIAFHYDHFYPGADPHILVMEFHSNGEMAGGRGPYENRYVTILRFRAGKVVLWKEYYDFIRGSGGLERLVRSTIKRQERAART